MPWWLLRSIGAGFSFQIVTLQDTAGRDPGYLNALPLGDS